MKRIIKYEKIAIKSTQVKGVLKLFKFFAAQKKFDLVKYRETNERGMRFACGKDNKNVTRETIQWNNFNAHIYTPKSVGDNFIVIYLHGGGYVSSDIDIYSGFISRLSHELKLKCYSFGYPLAPEHPYPQAIEAVCGFYKHLITEGVEASKIIFAGDSAGGGLSLAAVKRLQNEHLPLPAKLLLFSPWTDLTNSGSSITRNEKKDTLLTTELLKNASKLYCGEHSPELPEISPLFDDYTDFPPVFLMAGGHELLLSDSDRLHDVMEKCGVAINYVVWKNMPHAFIVGAKWFTESKAVFEHLREFVFPRLAESSN